MLCPKALTTSVSRNTTATPTSGQSRTFCIPNTYRGGRWTFQCCCVSEKQLLPQHFTLAEISIHLDWNPLAPFSSQECVKTAPVSTSLEIIF